MRIALCQLRPVAGDVAGNVDAHLRLARVAAAAGAELLAFPELSLTGYEPSLARGLAFAVEDARLAPLRVFAAASHTQLLVGAPLRTADKPRIGVARLAGDAPVRWLGKQYLHADELPFFAAQPPESPTVDVSLGDGRRLGLAICYELACEEHARRAFADGAVGYLALVAKTARGVAAAHARLGDIARSHRAPAWLANCTGPCEDGLTAGGSAAWNQDGELVAALGGDDEGVLLVDAASATARILRA